MSIKTRLKRLEDEAGAREPELVILHKSYHGLITGHGRTWTEEEVEALETDDAVQVIVLHAINETPEEYR